MDDKYQFTLRRALLTTAVVATWCAVLAMSNSLSPNRAAAFGSAAWAIAVVALPTMAVGALQLNRTLGIAFGILAAMVAALVLL